MAKGSIYLPVTSNDVPAEGLSKRRWPLIGLGLLAASAIITSWPFSVSQLITYKEDFSVYSGNLRDGLCAQAEPIMPAGYDTSKIWEEKDIIIKRLQEAVSVTCNISAESQID